ncbi:MAG TPA: type II toxin-antitoxin system ParD family antitoxin [Candidatus Methanoperedens sp.]
MKISGFIKPPTGSYQNMQRITLRLPEQQLKMIDMLVEFGEFPSASEAIRTAIRDLIDQRSEKLVGRMQLFDRAKEQSKNADSFLLLKEQQEKEYTTII